MKLGFFQNLDKFESSEGLDGTNLEKTVEVQLGKCTTNQFRLAVVAAVNQIVPEFRVTLLNWNFNTGVCVA